MNQFAPTIRPRSWLLPVAACLWAPFLIVTAQAQGVASPAGISDEELIELAYTYEDALNFGEADILYSLFDFPELGLRTAATFLSSPDERRQYVRGFSESDGGTNLVRTSIQQISDFGGYARYLRIITIDGVRGPLIRYDLGDAGYNWILLVAARDAGGDPRIVDMFVATNGQFLSTTLGAMGQLFTAPSSSLLDRLFGASVSSDELISRFRSISRYQLEGDYAAAYRELNSLPKAVREHRIVAGVAVRYASLVDPALYFDELANFAALYGDDSSATFTLLDYYFQIGDYAAALDSVAIFESTFGLDGAIGLIKTNIAVMSGDTKMAVAYAQSAAAVEPEGEDGYWALLSAYSAAGRYADSMDVIRDLEDAFFYEFRPEDFAANELYAGLVRSPEFIEWAAERP